MYFIEVGMVCVMVLDKEIFWLIKGVYFGEVVLVMKNLWFVLVFVEGEVKCVVLNVDVFERFLGLCMDIMKWNIIYYEE